MEPLPHPYDKLSWSAPEEERQAAIAELLAHPDRLDLGLLLRSGRKDVWDHAAAVLERIGFPRLEEHLPALLERLQDLNWPGAREVLRLLAQADPAVVRPQLGKAMTRASQEDDDDWLENLGQLAGMMREPGQDFRA